MGQVARVGKIEEWARRLARFEGAGETVARFCRREGVSASAFYAWKQRRQAAAALAGAASPAGVPRFLPVEIAPSQPATASRATVVRLAGNIQIEFGGDLPVVAAVVEQLLRATGVVAPTEDHAC